MQQGGDYGSQFYAHHYPPYHPTPNTGAGPNPNPSPNPNEFAPSYPNHPVYASAPPYSSYSSSIPAATAAVPAPAAAPAPYPPCFQHPDPISNIPPSAPYYTQYQSQLQDSSPQFPPYTQYSSPLFQQDQSSVAAPYSNHLQPSPPPYNPYDSQNNYAPQPNPNPDPSHKPELTTPFSSVYAPSESPYEGVVPRFDHGGGYYNENSGRYGLTAAIPSGQIQPGYEQDYFQKKNETAFQYGHARAQDGPGDGVYAYDGGRSEPYGARGTGTKSSSSSAWGGFDDYGRSTSFSSGRSDGVESSGKIIRAVPKAENQNDMQNGVPKFRVKLLPEGASVNTIDVLCQIGLDGIRMLDPSTNRTLRIYTLETVIRWEVMDSSIFCFWSKSPVDNEPKRIRLKSSSYTTNTILDTVTAASVQLKEMAASDLSRSRGSADSGKPSEQPSEKKKGFADWMIMMKPGNEEKEHWVPDEAVLHCTSCGVAFGPFVRRHHCRNCGDIFCDKCSQGRIALTTDENAQPVRVCDGCMAEVTQSLSIAKEAGKRSAAKQSHEDLARKLKEELEKNRKPSSGGSKSSDSSGRKMREVACPTCTVHLQVQVPSSGSETIECGVCQHPFLVSAH